MSAEALRREQQRLYEITQQLMNAPVNQRAPPSPPQHSQQPPQSQPGPYPNQQPQVQVQHPQQQHQQYPPQYTSQPVQHVQYQQQSPQPIQPHQTLQGQPGGGVYHNQQRIPQGQPNVYPNQQQVQVHAAQARPAQVQHGYVQQPQAQHHQLEAQQFVEAKIREMQVDHARQITSLTSEYEREIDNLRRVVLGQQQKLHEASKTANGVRDRLDAAKMNQWKQNVSGMRDVLNSDLQDREAVRLVIYDDVQQTRSKLAEQETRLRALDSEIQSLRGAVEFAQALIVDESDGTPRSPPQVQSFGDALVKKEEELPSATIPPSANFYDSGFDDVVAPAPESVPTPRMMLLPTSQSSTTQSVSVAGTSSSQSTAESTSTGPSTRVPPPPSF